MNEPSKQRWTAIVLAAGRGCSDPLAEHFGVSHKCLLQIDGVAMLKRVVNTLLESQHIGDVIISIEDRGLLPQALGEQARLVRFTPSQSSASQSAAAAVLEAGENYPMLLTTADHALLDQQMLDHFIRETVSSESDLTVGLASAETIFKDYPDAKRTFLAFGPDRVSGCNLYGLKTSKALRAIELWQTVEANRKDPRAIIRAFGIHALIRYLTKTIDLQSAFLIGSNRLEIDAKPILMPFANAAVDVDKPEDMELVERILDL